MADGDIIMSDAASLAIDWGNLNKRVEKLEEDVATLAEDLLRMKKKHPSLKGCYHCLARRYNCLKVNFMSVSKEKD